MISGNGFDDVNDFFDRLEVVVVSRNDQVVPSREVLLVHEQRIVDSPLTKSILLFPRNTRIL